MARHRSGDKMPKTQLGRTTISGQPSELAQIQEWADERNMSTSQFLKTAAVAFVKSETDVNSSYPEAEHVVEFSNRLTDIEQSLIQLETRLFGDDNVEADRTNLGIDQQVLDSFRVLFTQTKNLIVTQQEQLQRTISITTNLKQRLTAYRHPPQENLSPEPFAKRLMRKMKI